MRPVVATHPALTADEVRRLLAAGADHEKIVEHLVGTGIWSSSGASEIVRFLNEGPDELLGNHDLVPGAPLEQRARRALGPQPLRQKSGPELAEALATRPPSSPTIRP
jgi:hypothetical protein